MKYSYQPIDFAWASLGINYVIDAANWNPLEDPEKLIILSLEPFYKDPRLLSMFLAWAEEYDELINVGRLGAYLGGLNPFELSMLGAISLKLLKNSRWQRLNEKIVEKLGANPPKFPKRDDYQSLANISGNDEQFSAFGICIPKVTKAHGKKLKPKSLIAQKNYWFKFRLLLDSQMRADVAVAMYYLGCNNAYQVEQKIKCSRETAYRQFKSLKNPLVKLQIEILKKAAA